MRTTSKETKRKRATLVFDVMERRKGRGMGERHICTLRFPFTPYVPFTEEEVAEFVYKSHPSLRGKQWRAAITTAEIGARMHLSADVLEKL